MAFFTAEQKEEQGLIHGGFDPCLDDTPGIKEWESGLRRGTSVQGGNQVGPAVFGWLGFPSLLLGNVQAFECENCASD
jgi:hypothetical protein